VDQMSKSHKAHPWPETCPLSFFGTNLYTGMTCVWAKETTNKRNLLCGRPPTLSIKIKFSVW